CRCCAAGASSATSSATGPPRWSWPQETRQRRLGWRGTTSTSTWCRSRPGSVVIVVPVIPHADLPGAGVWWDVAPAEMSTLGVTAGLRAEYESDIKEQRWFGRAP